MSGKGLQHKAMTYEAYEQYYSQKDRAKLDPDSFAGPNQTFPILTPTDVSNAARLIGHAAHPEAIKTAIIRIARHKGFALPKEWEEQTTKESTTAFQPKQRVARFKSYFLEDGAISLNGRKYPASTVDRLIQSVQLQLSDPDALPLNCYTSHQEADQDSTRNLVGKITSVGREGTKAYAMVDIPDTVAGRDVATLLSGGYIRSQSLRASGAEMRMDSESAFPLVGGNNLKLIGIDFTTSPGLSSVARTTDVVLESHDPQSLIEVFNSSPAQLLLEQDEEVSMDITEETIAPQSSGTTVGMTDGSPRDAYSTRMYRMPPDANAATFPVELGDVHDRLAYVVGLDCGPTTMEARKRFGEEVVKEAKSYQDLQESGAKLSATSKMHLLKAHDGVAKHLGMECSDSSSSNDGMQDGDNDDQPSGKQENTALTRQDVEKLLREALQSQTPKPVPVARKEITKPMTSEEAARLLLEAGYKIEAPKTRDQIVQESIDAQKLQLEIQQKQIAEQQATQQQQFEELKKMLTERNSPLAYAPPPQRKSLVEGSDTQETKKKPYYRSGDYLREQLREMNREELLDRSRPLPEGLNLERFLGEMQVEYLGLYDAVYGLTGDLPRYGR